MNGKLFVLVLLAIGLVGYDHTKNQPLRMAAITSQETANSKLRDDLAIAKQVHEKVIALKQEIEQTTSLINGMLNRLPTRTEVGALLEQITKVTKGLRFESVSPQGIVSKTVNVKLSQPPITGTVTYEQMELSMEMLATFRELGKYLDNLEKIPRLVEVIGLKMTSFGPGKPMTVKMSVKTYIYGGK